ncbi:MAG: transaldolase family protein [Lachnospiraceae bacterium]|nr:transaldolase family protein [Lachnospiraceae bacterium]
MAENKFLRWMTQNTQSVYWHDSAVISELDEAISNGARGVTTNPFLVNSTLRSTPEFWADTVAAVDKSLTGDAKVEALIHGVTGYIADKLAPFQAEGFGKGYCCAQTSPARPGQAEYMIEQAKKYASWAPNIVIKMPATKAGLKAYEECAALGLNVAATVSFTVPQVLAFGEAFQKGAERAKANGIKPGLGIAVLMVGRTDDYLRDVMQDTDADCGEEDVIWAGLACIKRAYEIFQERGYECVLMPAGCRGGHHITELAGAKMIMSIAPKISKLLLDVKEDEFEEKIQNPVDPAKIRRLQSMPEFVKAYEPNGLSVDEFIGYGATNRTLTQFVECGWSPLAAL